MDMCGQLGPKLDKFSWIASISSRITIGVVFISSGWGKLHHLPQVVEFFQSLGIPGAQFQAPMVALIELVCGSLVLIGFCTRLAAIPLVGTMIVAIITAKWPDLTTSTEIFSISEFLYIVILFHLIGTGAGCCSVDSRLNCKS